MPLKSVAKCVCSKHNEFFNSWHLLFHAAAAVGTCQVVLFLHVCVWVVVVVVVLGRLVTKIFVSLHPVLVLYTIAVHEPLSVCCGVVVMRVLRWSP